MDTPIDERNFVPRLSDGKPINIPRKRGQLSFCMFGCCCGLEHKGRVPVLPDVYQSEWEGRTVRNVVHLNQSGCLGPCQLSNSALLLFDGHPVYFQSVDTPETIRAIFDYIEALMDAPAFFLPPPPLAAHVFSGFAWDGMDARPQPALVAGSNGAEASSPLLPGHRP